MNDKKKYKYLTKVQKVAGMEVTLYSIDGNVWSSRQDELAEIADRHDRERSSFGGEIKGQVTGGKSPFRGGRPAGRPRREHYVPPGGAAEPRTFDMDDAEAGEDTMPLDDEDMRLGDDSDIEMDADLDRDEPLDEVDEEMEESPAAAPAKKRGRPSKAAIAAKAAAAAKPVMEKAKKAKPPVAAPVPPKKQAPAKKQPASKKAAPQKPVAQKASKPGLPKAKPRAGQAKSAKKAVGKAKAKKKAA